MYSYGTGYGQEGYGCYNPCYTPCPCPGFGSGTAIILVLFILLVIVIGCRGC